MKRRKQSRRSEKDTVISDKESFEHLAQKEGWNKFQSDFMADEFAVKFWLKQALYGKDSGQS